MSEAKSAFQLACEELEADQELSNHLFLQPLAQDLIAGWLTRLFVAAPYTSLKIIKGAEYEFEDDDKQPLENFVSVVAATASPMVSTARRAARGVSVTVTLHTSRDITMSAASAVFSGILNALQIQAMEEGLAAVADELSIPVLLAGRISDQGEVQDVADGSRAFSKTFLLPLAPSRADTSPI